MTALHRRWLESGDVPAREKITVLNLRHSLVAARAAGLARWQPGLSVNRLLAAELGDAFGCLAHPVFTRCWGASMPRDCVVLAIEGIYASGKTTLTHALAAYYRERGIHVATVEEPARHSPFIE